MMTKTIKNFYLNKTHTISDEDLKTIKELNNLNFSKNLDVKYQQKNIIGLFLCLKADKNNQSKDNIKENTKEDTTQQQNLVFKNKYHCFENQIENWFEACDSAYINDNIYKKNQENFIFDLFIKKPELISQFREKGIDINGDITRRSLIMEYIVYSKNNFVFNDLKNLIHEGKADLNTITRNNLNIVDLLTYNPVILEDKKLFVDIIELLGKQGTNKIQDPVDPVVFFKVIFKRNPELINKLNQNGFEYKKMLSIEEIRLLFKDLLNYMNYNDLKEFLNNNKNLLTDDFDTRKNIAIMQPELLKYIVNNKEKEQYSIYMEELKDLNFFLNFEIVSFDNRKLNNLLLSPQQYINNIKSSSTFLNNFLEQQAIQANTKNNNDKNQTNIL